MEKLEETIKNNEEKKALLRSYMPKMNPNLE